MSQTQRGLPGLRRPLRLWPGVVIVIVQWLVRFGLPIIEPEATPIAILTGLAGGLAIVVWWLFFSRAQWAERLGAVALMALGLYATPYLVHESVATGAMGLLLPVLAVPVLSLAFVVWAAATRGLADSLRRTTMVATILLACGMWTLVRTGGFDSNFQNDLTWRWSLTPEERLLAQAAGQATVRPPAAAPAQNPGEPASTDARDDAARPPAAAAATPPPSADAKPANAAGAPGRTMSERDATRAEGPAASDPGIRRAEWPGFRGPDRDGIVRGVRIETDWAKTPPVELWRRPVGPGWSSFAVRGDLFYTQEQRGDDEVVACYRVSTGEPVWLHRDAARFWESNAGAGPRGTPTLSGNRVYTFGATGIVNALDAATGALVWSRNAAGETGTPTPVWGFASSPLVIDDLVVVAVSGALVAYDRDTGSPRWTGPDGSEGYSSPHLATLDGVPQVLMVNGDGAIGVAPANGSLLWKYEWGGYPIVQPGLTDEGDILVSVQDRSGLRRVAVDRGPDGWSVEERWTSISLKPYFNDFVVHEGHAYGFDGGILASIDLADGARRWKGGRYGRGQLVLLPEQDLLLVLSEEGELALVGATPDGFREFARVPGIDGKTWNHPVVAGGVLLVRNAEEMAAFRLPIAGK